MPLPISLLAGLGFNHNILSLKLRSLSSCHHQAPVALIHYLVDVFATVGFLHLAGVPVEVGVGPAHELGPLRLAVLVAMPEIFIFLSSELSGPVVPSHGWLAAH